LHVLRDKYGLMRSRAFVLLEALLHRPFVWHLKLSLLSIVIPKSITDSEIGIGISFRAKKHDLEL